MDEGTYLEEGLLRSEANRLGAKRRRERPLKNGRVKARDIGVDEPGSYKVEHFQPGECDPPNPFLPPSGDTGKWRGTKHAGYGRQHYAFENDGVGISKKMQNSRTPEEEDPWGDWGPG